MSVAGASGSIDVPPGVTLSRKGAKSRTGGRKLRSTGTKAARVGQARQPSVDLKQQLEACRRELAEAVEAQTAVSDILRIISTSPTDIQPVFDTIAVNALRLCKAAWSGVVRFDGQLMHLVALHNLSKPEGVDAIRRAYPRPPGRGGA